jgi:hypothetical protein
MRSHFDIALATGFWTVIYSSNICLIRVEIFSGAVLGCGFE